MRGISEYGPAHGSERWRVAKDKKLCFRCLSSNHQGKHCFQSRDCGIDGCKRSHHKLLHLLEDVTNRVASVGDANISNISSTLKESLHGKTLQGTPNKGPKSIHKLPPQRLRSTKRLYRFELYQFG